VKNSHNFWIGPSAKNSHEFWTRLLESLASEFGKPTDDLPSTRCIPKEAFIHTLVKIRKELKLDGYKNIPGAKVLDYLVTARLVRLIVVQTPDGQTQEKFVVIGFGESLEVTEPLELLQTLVKDGVLCYFTAISYHRLSTQPVPYHHIARLRSYPERSSAIQSIEVKVTDSNLKDRSYDPLGTKQFSYKGIPYYVTQRDQRLMPGLQKRYLDERTIIQITTLEQTLLDTLHKPFSCGGVAVVFEAWETALGEIREDRLISYLQAINNSELNRRVGYMLENLHHKLGDSLEAYLHDQLSKVPDSTPIPLLPGLPSSNVDSQWLVMVP
jgi:hypothetical protein